MTTKTVQLKHPFEAMGKTFSEVVFRRPKAADMPLIARLEEIEKAAGESGPSPADEAEATFLLIRVVTGLPAAVIEELDLMEDLPAVSEEAAGFLESIAPRAPGSGAA